MGHIPSCCPSCGSKQWKERINALTSGIPVAGGGRFRLISIRGFLAEPVKRKLGFYKVKYRCEKCGFEGHYDLDEKR